MGGCWVDGCKRWVGVGLMGREMGGCWVDGCKRWVGVGSIDGEMGGCWVDVWRDGWVLG